MIRALLVTVFLVLYIPPACILGWSLAWWQPSARPLYGLGRFGIRTALRLAGVRVEVEGGEKLHDCAYTVVVPKHPSHLDAPVLFTVLAPDFKVVAKKELFKLPFLGHTLRIRAGHVRVLDTVDAGAHRIDDRDRLVVEVRGRIAAALS